MKLVVIMGDALVLIGTILMGIYIVIFRRDITSVV